VALGMLKKFGLRADAVANGREAVKALEDIPYDLVLMDVQMPDMDGIAATQRIRDTESSVINHDIPIIAMTADAMQGAREKCIQAGMDDYISKPVSPVKLAEALDKWLGKDETEDENNGDSMEKVTSLNEKSDKMVFDKEDLMERLMQDESIAQAVTDAFLTDIDKQITELESSIAAGDIKQSQRVAHSIKGAASNVAGESLRQLAFKIEQACKEGDIDYAANQKDELKSRAEKLKIAIRQSMHSTIC